MIARAAALCALGLLVLVAPAGGHFPPAPAQPCPGGSDAVLAKGQWTLIKAPKGLGRIVTHAVGGTDGALVLASDGKRVQRSSDGGCTWERSYDIETADLPDSDELPRVVSAMYVGERAFLVLDGVGRAAGSRLLRSDDRGATWRTAGQGLPGAGRFRDLVPAGASLFLTVALNETAGDNDQAGVTGALYRSNDGGKNWSSQSSGAPIESLAVDPVEPETLYAVRATHAVQRSDDGGRSWRALAIGEDPDDSFEPGAPELSNWRAVTVGRNAADEPASVAVAASATRIADVSRVAVSEDGGDSFEDISPAGLGPISTLTFGNSSDQLLLASGSSSTAFRGPGLFTFDVAEGRWRDVDDLRLRSLREARGFALSAAARGHDGLVAFQLRRDAAPGAGRPPDVLARYVPADPPRGDGLLKRIRCEANKDPSEIPDDSAPKGGRARHHGEDHEDAGPVKFAPGDLEVQLEPGIPSRVALKAELGPVPTPLDVDFVIDSSNSMDDAIDGVRCSAQRLAHDLVDRGVDARFGVADFNDHIEDRFRRKTDLVPYSNHLLRSIASVFTRIGRDEPIRSALYQAATGAGLETTDIDNQGTRVTVKVPPGQQANYRPGALHTTLLIGNEPYNETTPGEPSREEVADALRRKGIRVIGLQVVTPAVQVKDPTDPSTITADRDNERARPDSRLILTEQMRYFAGQSGATAPRGGVDCDGGGTPDVPEGEPLVCQIDERGIRESMGDTLVTLLRQVQDVQDVELVPLEDGGLQLGVEDGRREKVDVTEPSELAGTAVLACTAQQAGRAFEVAFGVRVAGRTVGRLDGIAFCGEQAAAKLVPRRARPAQASQPAASPSSPAPSKPAPAPASSTPPPPPSPGPQPAVAVAPPGPPPAPAPVSSAPAPSAASAPAAASAPSAAAAPSPVVGVAAAPHREAAPQVAHADGDHAMVAWRPRREREAIPAPALITLGLGACGAFGWIALAAGRRRPRVAPQRVRR